MRRCNSSLPHQDLCNRVGLFSSMLSVRPISCGNGLGFSDEETLGSIVGDQHALWPPVFQEKIDSRLGCGLAAADQVQADFLTGFRRNQGVALGGLRCDWLKENQS